MVEEYVFKEFPKIPRLSREIIITEKIDGTNACIIITADGQFLTGSKSRLIVPGDDNFGFSRWAHENKDELMKLGVGTHHGEWWGNGIQRHYGQSKKRFSLFNVSKWSDTTVRPTCCDVVPILYKGAFDTNEIQNTLNRLKVGGSLAAAGFMDPEGVVIFHTASQIMFKKTIERDEEPKGLKGKNE